MKPNHRMPMSKKNRPKLSRAREQGVVLIMSLILLVVISMLSISSLRSVSASEITLGNVRKTEMATQAAEFVLRWCEEEVTKFKNGETTTLTINDYADPPLWDEIDSKTKALKNWDGAGTDSKVNLPDATMMNQSGLKYATYLRLPECMVEPAENKAVADASIFRITARGFGPEVSAVDNKRSRPNGTESWLQSTITIN